MALPEEPYTRVEQYLARLAGQNVDIPDYPITRIECYLDYLVNNGGGAAAPNAGAHNAIFRGQSLGNALTDAQVEAISSGTFDGIFVGDYWEAGGVVWRVAGMDLFLNIGDTSGFNIHHAVIVPDTALYNHVMNTSGTTEGGYYNSELKQTGLINALTAVESLFGEGHVLTRRTLLSNVTGTSGATGWTWADSKIDIMSEGQVYGRIGFGASGGYNVGDRYQMFPLFELAPQFIRIRNPFWLQDILANNRFAGVSTYGNVNFYPAGDNRGVRPYFCIGDAS